MAGTSSAGSGGLVFNLLTSAGAAPSPRNVFFDTSFRTEDMVEYALTTPTSRGKWGLLSY